jgi:DNA-directed RNA polymerase subunit H (RpoH/RPB5)
MFKQNYNQLLKMMSTRGFSACERDEEDIASSITVFIRNGKDNGKQYLSDEKNNIDRNTIIVCFQKDHSYDITDTRNLIKYMEEYQAYQGLAVYSGKITAPAKNALIIYPQMIKHLPISYFYFDPTEHEDVPNHYLVHGKELEDIKKVNNWNNIIPKILISDPIMTYYGWEIGNVIRIEDGDDLEYVIISV